MDQVAWCLKTRCNWFGSSCRGIRFGAHLFVRVKERSRTGENVTRNAATSTEVKVIKLYEIEKSDQERSIQKAMLAEAAR
jgi:hypothetical protein